MTSEVIPNTSTDFNIISRPTNACSAETIIQQQKSAVSRSNHFIFTRIATHWV